MCPGRVERPGKPDSAEVSKKVDFNERHQVSRNTNTILGGCRKKLRTKETILVKKNCKIFLKKIMRTKKMQQTIATKRHKYIRKTKQSKKYD